MWSIYTFHLKSASLFISYILNSLSMFHQFWQNKLSNILCNNFFFLVPLCGTGLLGFFPMGDFNIYALPIALAEKWTSCVSVFGSTCLSGGTEFRWQVVDSGKQGLWAETQLSVPSFREQLGIGDMSWFNIEQELCVRSTHLALLLPLGVINHPRVGRKSPCCKNGYRFPELTVIMTLYQGGMFPE